MKKAGIALAFCLTIATALCLLQSTGRALEYGKDTTRTLRIGGIERSYILYLPESVKDKKSVPVVLVFHGGGGNARQVRRFVHFDEVAAAKGFAVVYPNGSGRLGTMLLTWNAGSCCAWAKDHNVDDVGFVRAILDDLETVLPVDKKRVYATGMSNGGMMSHRLGCELADRIAAVAPVSGGLEITNCNPSRPVPVLHIHGTKDQNVQWQGGVGPNSISGVAFRPVETTINDWVAINGCRGQAKEEKLPDRADDGTSLVKQAWTDCKKGADVVLLKIENGGHTWPGSIGRKWGKFGNVTKEIQASAVIWSFFENHPMP